MSETLERIDEMVKNHSVVLFMKERPQFPSAVFRTRRRGHERHQSALCLVQCAGRPTGSFGAAEISGLANLPQLYLKGELVGGCDITMDLYQSGELKGMVEEAAEDFPQED